MSLKPMRNPIVLYRSCLIIFPSAKLIIPTLNTYEKWEFQSRQTVWFYTHQQQVEREQWGMSSWWECSERTELITENALCQVSRRRGSLRSSPGYEKEREREITHQNKDNHLKVWGVGCGVVIQSDLALVITISSSCKQEEQEEQDAINN